MLFVAERRRHHAPRRMIPIGVGIFAIIQRQMLDQRLAPDALARHPRPADGFVALFTRRMHHIQRHARHISNHDRAVRRLTLDLRRAGIGMRLWPGIARGQQLGRQLCHDIAILGMDHRDPAQL